MAKLARSQKAVDEFMKERAHKNMLVHEQKRLHDQDMKKTNERAKRLEDKRKRYILEKEQKDKGVFKEVLKREKKMVDLRYRNTVSRMIHSEKFESQMADWANKGLSLATLSKEEAALASKVEKMIKSSSKSPEKKLKHVSEE